MAALTDSKGIPPDRALQRGGLDRPSIINKPVAGFAGALEAIAIRRTLPFPGSTRQALIEGKAPFSNLLHRVGRPGMVCCESFAPIRLFWKHPILFDLGHGENYCISDTVGPLKFRITIAFRRF